MATAGKLAYIFPGNAYRKRLLVVRAIEPMEPARKPSIMGEEVGILAVHHAWHSATVTNRSYKRRRKDLNSQL